MADRKCRRGHRLVVGETAYRKSNGYLVCIACQKLRDEASRNGETLPDARRFENEHPNPWAGRVECPDCGSSEWTMPYDPLLPDSSWRCVACHVWAAGPMRKTAP